MPGLLNFWRSSYHAVFSGLRSAARVIIMNLEHKQLIENNLDQLVDMVYAPDLFEELKKRDVFRGSMAADLEELLRKNFREGTRKFLADLPKRGPKAFARFSQALWDSGHVDAATMLSIPKTERNQSSVSQFVQLCDQVRDDSGASMRIVHLVHETDAKGFNPKSVPDKEIIVPKVQHPERKVKPADLYNNGITEDVYQMMSKPRGYALIMNNEVFDYELELKTRTGSEVDVMSLKDVLEQCDFKVEIHRNKHSGDMKRILKNFASKAEHAHVDATMVVIMSHGNSEKGRDFVYSCDHREIDREWILTQFNNANAPALQNKPKVFLFQCCRGDEPDVGVVPKEMAFAGRIETDGKSDDVPQMRKMPTFSHMLIANATVPGYASFRSPKEGTWFIQTLCQEIADHACDRHFVKMLKKVTETMSELESDYAHKQVPELTERLFRKMFFNPGLSAPTKED